MNGKEKVLSQIIELRETDDIKEVARLLRSGNWIAICATESEPVVFSLGRVEKTKEELERELIALKCKAAANEQTTRILECMYEIRKKKS